jgi:hypothetical protein
MSTIRGDVEFGGVDEQRLVGEEIQDVCGDHLEVDVGGPPNWVDVGLAIVQSVRLADGCNIGTAGECLVNFPGPLCFGIFTAEGGRLGDCVLQPERTGSPVAVMDV